MKIGIIVYSQTGNTLSVAERLEKELTNAGHTVSIERIIAQNESDSKLNSVTLTNEPKTNDYDALIFGAPVHAFNAAAAMQAYLKKQTQIKKPVMIFVTMLFPFAFLGGNGAIKKLCALCSSKGAIVSKTGIINWSNAEKREKKITQLIDRFKI